MKKMFLEISQNSQENTCTRVCLFFNKVASLIPDLTPPVAASENKIKHLCFLNETNITLKLNKTLVSLSLDWKKKYDDLEKYSSISHAQEIQDASLLTCARCMGNNMTIKQQINLGPFKKYFIAQCHFSFHSPVSLCQLYYITSPALFTKENTQWNERKEYFLYIWLLQHTCYIKRGKK